VRLSILAGRTADLYSKEELSVNWITTAEAAKIMGVTNSHVIHVARQRNWDLGKSGQQFTVRQSDANSFKRSKARYSDILGRPSESPHVKKIVAWADALPDWPSDEEIDAWTTDVYRRKDVESVIESRRYRGASPLKRRAQ
jgi:hypothetical protein